MLINELSSMVRCDDSNVLHPPSTATAGGSVSDDAASICSGHSDSGHQSRRQQQQSLGGKGAAAAAAQRRMDKSSVLRSTIDYLKRYYESKRREEAANNASSSEAVMETQADGDDSWKPSFLSFEEFAYLMLDVSSPLEVSRVATNRLTDTRHHRRWMRSSWCWKQEEEGCAMRQSRS